MHERERVPLVNMDILSPYPRAANIQQRPPLVPPPPFTNHRITKSFCCPPFSIKQMNQSIILFIPDHEPPSPLHACEWNGSGLRLPPLQSHCRTTGASMRAPPNATLRYQLFHT